MENLVQVPDRCKGRPGFVLAFCVARSIFKAGGAEKQIEIPRPFVAVAEQQDGVLAVRMEEIRGKNFLELKMPLDTRKPKMKIHNDDWPSRSFHDMAQTAAPLLDTPGEVEVFTICERPARECRVAIAADLELDIATESVMIAEHIRQYFGKIEVAAARHAVVDFLQRNDIGLFGFADTRNALRVELAVVADGLMDVVCQDGNQQRRNLLHGQG